MNTVSELKAAIDKHIQSLELNNRKPANLYVPMHYILSLKGKRIRPILTMLAYQAVSGKSPQKAINLAVAIELFHNFTLMHDDIMDSAPMRRGEATVHIKWNENIAILSGDAMFALSMGLIASDFSGLSDVLCKEYVRVALAVCEGQMEDMDLAQAENASITQYIEMIRKKTAVLLGACMSMGALAAGATEEVVDQFRQFGEDLGIAFQLQDDLMDAFPPEGFGKQIGGDIIEGKKTYLLLKAYELANTSESMELDLAMQESDPELRVNRVLELFKKLDIATYTNGLIQQYFEKAVALARNLENITEFQSVKSYLQEVAKRKL